MGAQAVNDNLTTELIDVALAIKLATSNPDCQHEVSRLIYLAEHILQQINIGKAS
jgi:hypothetical protein